MATELEGPAVSQQQIAVYGIAGEFRIGDSQATNNDNTYRVRYFNTVASSYHSDHAGNSRELLSELKPMRERIRPAELNDLSALLQRELNDYRVAHDLIPYLKGRNAEVGFFPGILVALVPKEFLLAKENSPSYPTSTKETDSKVDYNGFWSLETFAISGNPTALGTLRVDPNKTDLIVLDGQHRANAFRYMADAFSDATSDTIYSPFYQECKVPEEYYAELPVTIVWFEHATKPISPVMISRRLFVDVNTNARPVQESRNILLDDGDLASIATTSIYASIAKNGFSKSTLSLLHSGFDVEENQAPKLSLFSPALLRYSLSYFLLSGDDYDKLSKIISNDFVDHQANKSRFIRVVGELRHGLLEKVEKGDDSALEQLHTRLQNSLSFAIIKILTDFTLLQPHYFASESIEEYSNTEADHVESMVWNKIFCGGEGLYSSFASLNPSGKAKPYKTAIAAIENRFEKERAAQFTAPLPVVNQAYDTLCTKATITAVLMAFGNFSEAEPEVLSDQAIESFVAALNSISADNWIQILTGLKPHVIKSLAPKEWPAMRRIVLRVLQHGSDYKSFSDANLNLSPEWNVAAGSVSKRMRGWKDAHRTQMEPVLPSSDDMESWVNSAVNETNDILDNCGLTKIYDHDFFKESLFSYADQLVRQYEKEWEEI